MAELKGVRQGIAAIHAVRAQFIAPFGAGSWGVMNRAPTGQTKPSQTSQTIRMHAIPLDVSLCWVRGIVRFCGGLSTTILFSNQSLANDALLLQLGGNLHVGTELFHHGPFSIRADIFGRIVFAPRPFAAGIPVTGLRSFD